MDMNSIQVTAPIAAALIVVIGLFLRYMQNENEKNRQMWGNHLSHTVEALQALVVEVRIMQVANDKNMEWAKEAVARLIDKP